MVDYSYYYVQPNQSQGFSALNNAIQFKKETDQRDFHNKLLERGTNMEMQRGERAERRLDLQEKREMSESDWKLLGMQADFLSRVLEPAVDDETFQVSRRAIESVAVDDKGQPTPMAKSEFFQSIYRTMPEKFDPEKINKAKSVFNSLSKKAAEKAHGSHQTFYDEKGTPYRKWVNAGEDLVLPPGHKTGDQIKADAAQIRKETPTAGGGDNAAEKERLRNAALAANRARFSAITKALINPMTGKPFKGKEQEYSQSLEGFKRDEAAIYEGKTPTNLNPYLRGEGGPAEKPEPKQIDRATAIEYMRKANGDRAKAAELAKQDGYSF